MNYQILGGAASLRPSYYYNAASWVPEKFNTHSRKMAPSSDFPFEQSLGNRNIYKLFNCLKEIQMNKRIYLEIFLMYK